MAAGPTQFGRLSVWGMIKALVEANLGTFTFAGAPVNGTSGTYAGFAAPGATVIDTTTGNQYVNIGTLASPVWANTSGAVSGLGGLGGVSNAKMTYSFATDGGAISTITPSNSPTIPANAIILGGTVDVTFGATSGGAATIALGLGSGAQVAALRAATAVASWPIGLGPQLAPTFTAATYFKVAAATRLTITIAAFALTAGIISVNVVYVQGNAT